jgi:predicted DNA-binding protein
MASKTQLIKARIEPDARERLKRTLDRLGLSESEYVRGAIEAQLRRDERSSRCN